MNESNLSLESADSESCCSSLHIDEFVDSDEKDIVELNQMLLKLKSIGFRIRSVASNQAKVIYTVKKNSKKISDSKRNTAKQFNEFTDLIAYMMDCCQQMRKGECEFKNLEL